MKMHVRLTLLDEVLGTKPSNDKVFREYIASLAPEDPPEDELEAATAAAAKAEKTGTTIFHTDGQGRPGIWNYQIKGLFKDCCSALNRFDKDARNGLDKLSAYKTRIDGCIFVSPRFIPFVMPEGAAVGICERPLRADTAQGPRVSLCRSETVPAGSKLVFEVNIFEAALQPYVELWFSYGKLRGLGQWRNSGKGIFSTEYLSDEQFAALQR
jgi:hypothetical protein